MTRAAGMRLARVGLWLATGAAIAYGLHRLEPLALAVNEGPAWHAQIRWVDAPPSTRVPDWIFREALSEPSLIPLYSESILAPQLCGRIAAGLAKSPWIAEVQRVARSAGGEVSIKATFREYLTYVVKDNTGYLVDRSGVRLPRDESATKLTDGQFLILEGVFDPVPEVGQPWPGQAVAGGLKLVHFLETHCPEQLRPAFVAVDVSNYNNRRNRLDGWLSIRTLYPCHYIRWGYPPGETSGTESSAERKIEMLWTVFRQQGQLPGANPLDVRNEDAIWGLNWHVP